MRQTTEAFRSRYRAAIHPLYNPWLHGAFVLLFGVLAIGAFWSSVHQVSWLEWLSVPLTLLFFTWRTWSIAISATTKTLPKCSTPGMRATITASLRPAT